MMNVGWLVGGLMIGPFLYILVTLFTPRLRGVDDYQFGNRNLNPADVVDSSIMYGLQVAAIALFATWGYTYGLAALVVPAFWMAGYFLFSHVLSDAFLTRFAVDGNFRTLHGFLADHNRARSVCITAAMLTLVGLAGPAMFEAFTVGSAVAQAVPNFGPAGGAGLALAFLAVSLVYMTRSGFPGVVRLDQLQMTIGYGGLCLAFAGSLIFFMKTIGAASALWLSLGCLVAALIIAVMKIKHDFATVAYLSRFAAGAGPRATADILGLTAVTLGVGSFAISATVAVLDLNAASPSPSLLAFATSQFSFSFTLLATFSLLVANGLYQFVDVTQWQRLLSLAVDRGNLPAVARMLRDNVITGGVCSAATWVIAVAFGVFLKGLFPQPETDPYNLIATFLAQVAASPSEWAGVLVLVFMAALVAIMFSTLDALVAATAFTVQQDVLGGSERPGALTVARFVTVAVIAAQLGLYLTISALAGDRVDAVLYICWSFQLAMVPIVLLLIQGRGGAPLARTLAMIAGCAGALAPLFAGLPDKAYEWSPWMAVGASTLVYLSFGGWRRRAVTSLKDGA